MHYYALRITFYALFTEIPATFEIAGDFDQTPHKTIVRPNMQFTRLIGRESLHPDRFADRLRAAAVLLGRNAFCQHIDDAVPEIVALGRDLLAVVLSRIRDQA